MPTGSVRTSSREPSSSRVSFADRGPFTCSEEDGKLAPPSVEDTVP